MSLCSNKFSCLRLQKSLVLFALLGTGLCLSASQTPLQAADVADLVLINGKIITVDSQDTIVQAVAAKGGLILAVGTTQQINAYIGPNTTVIDLAGKTVTPGLIDSHTHLAHYGQTLLESVSLRPPGVTSIVTLVAAIAERIETTAADDWVLGEGFFQMAENRNPTRYDLDPVSPNNPVFVSSIGGHFGTANSKALEAAEIDKDTLDPVGGFIERDPITGEPTGLLWNHQAMDLVRKKMPPPTRELSTAEILFAQDRYLAEGLTSFHDNNTRGMSRLLGYWDAEAGLKLRGYLMFDIEREADATIALQNAKLYQGPMLTYNGNKFFLDGQAPTSYTYQPHPGTSWDKTTWDIATFKRLVKDLHNDGRQLSFHVMGDAAIDLAIDAIEEALTASPRANHRHRLEHVGIPTLQAIQRIKQLGIVVVTQPAIINMSGSAFAFYWSGERLQRLVPVKSILDAGIPLGLSSDFPEVLQLSPQLTLWGAVVRESDTGVVMTPSERITIQQALRAHTMGSAYAAFEENQKGSIEIGKLADFTVWSGDLYTVPADQIKDLRAVMTIVGGKVVSRIGDANFDGAADVADLVALTRIATGAEKATDAQKITCDFDNDKSIDIADWIAALRALVADQ